MKPQKIKRIIKAEYENGEVWVLIRNWNSKDHDQFYKEQKVNHIKSLSSMPLEDFDKDNNTGRWWNVAKIN